MAEAVSRGRDRRQLNVPAVAERRGKGTEKRRCPDCNGALTQSSRRVAGGSVLTSSCAACGWSHSSRQTDADTLLLKMSWSLQLERKSGLLSASFPPELTEALGLKAGDQLLLSPLVLPLGKEAMKWALTVQGAPARKKR
jgi:hypothetical protein